MDAVASKVLRCRRDLRVQSVLQTWWEAVQYELRERGHGGDGVDHVTFMDIFKNIYRAMASEYVEAEADRTVRADWDDLVRHEEAIDGLLREAELKGILFELAMTWILGANPKRYAAFLLRLLDVVTRDGRLAPLEAIEEGSGQPQWEEDHEEAERQEAAVVLQRCARQYISRAEPKSSDRNPRGAVADGKGDDIGPWPGSPDHVAQHSHARDVSPKPSAR